MTHGASADTAPLWEAKFAEFAERRYGPGGLAAVRDLYVEHLLPVAQAAASRDPDVMTRAAGIKRLVCLLGDSPEVIVVAAAVIKPIQLTVITTAAKAAGLDDIRKMIESGNFQTLAEGVTVKPISVEFSDVIGIYQGIMEAVSDAHRPGSRASELGVLIAGGTNEMVAALSAGAFAANLTTFYLEAGRGRPPRPDAQKMRLVPNPLEVFGPLDIPVADAAFRAGRYDEALAACQRLAEAGGDPHKHGMRDMVAMCRLYAAVQRFDYDYQAAATVRPSTALFDHHQTMFAALSALRPPPKAEESSAPATKKAEDAQRKAREDHWAACAAWLVRTAKHQYRTGQYVQCSATAYRALEALCQLQCSYRFHWRAKTPAAEVRRIDGVYADTLALMEKELELTPEDPPRLCGLLGLIDRYAILRACNDPIATGEDSVTVGQLYAIVEGRNQSLLAHGFSTPSGAGCLQLINVVDYAVKGLAPRIKSQYQKRWRGFAFQDPLELRALQLHK